MAHRDPDLHHAISLRPRPTYHRNTSDDEDVEQHTQPSYNEANDPYSLRTAFKSSNELEVIGANTSRKRSGCKPIAHGKEAQKAKQMQSFYESQNENIERLLKPVDEHVRLAKERMDSNALQYKIAVIGSFVVCQTTDLPSVVLTCCRPISSLPAFKSMVQHRPDLWRYSLPWPTRSSTP